MSSGASIVTNVAFWLGILIAGETTYVWTVGKEMGKSLYLSLFCQEPKTALKIKSFRKVKRIW